MDSYFDLLVNGIKEWGIQTEQLSIDKFKRYLSLLLEWNSKFNLTAITNEGDIITKHFLDSLSSARFIKFKNQSIVDVGTGAGFPAIPIKLVFPEIKITLVDSSLKKTIFLNKLCEELDLSDYNVIHDNIESVGQDQIHREKYDIVLTRAVAEFRCLLEYGIPLLKINGIFIAYKGPNSQAEVDNSQKALQELNAKITENHEITLPFTEYKRRLVIVEKIGITDTKYPRKTGTPRKKPL